MTEPASVNNVVCGNDKKYFAITYGDIVILMENSSLFSG